MTCHDKILNLFKIESLEPCAISKDGAVYMYTLPLTESYVISHIQLKKGMY